MANYRRKKSKRKVKCTMCTPHRWYGNSSNRHKSKEQSKKKEDKKEIKKYKS